MPAVPRDGCAVLTLTLILQCGLLHCSSHMATSLFLIPERLDAGPWEAREFAHVVLGDWGRLIQDMHRSNTGRACVARCAYTEVH